ncbi:MAG: VCBS repeat-containing protein [Gemmatimonadaceae bacterium]|nr:VCBS repeat-containing protein [Gemmatimonadaceae bacterium]
MAAIAMGGCRGSEAEKPLFESLAPAVTGVTFSNDLPEKADFNPLNYLYYYNGGGVAAGDVNGDGLPDLYFTANLGKNRLYINKGHYRFEDVTDRAGVAGPPGWKTGVTMADVNGDGKLDIFVSAVSYRSMKGRNVLYVNNGDGTFTDRTAELGLEHSGYSTQAVFFDYDGDGDLDMFLLSHSTHTERSGSARAASDILYRNDGSHFTDVTAAAGIHEVDGFGLGVVASDLNGDGCPDLYVGNDFQEDDALWINNCDGTFTDRVRESMPHTSRFSMGVDAADFDGDGRIDLISLDMLTDREDIFKTAAGADGYALDARRAAAGFQSQVTHNALQLNRGAGLFSDVAFLAGVAATDWSWCPLFADLDNDGRKDLFITNGIYRRPNDLDYIAFVGSPGVQATLGDSITEANLALLKQMPSVPLPNYAFRNDGGLAFSSVADAWGLAAPGFSSGAAYVDLDNSGALDLVVNNVNAPASIHRNTARAANGNHYLTVTLAGAGANTEGIGAKVIVRQGGATQLLEQQPTRGFESSVDRRLHFGLGKATRVDSLTVIWPDRRWQTLTNVAADQRLTLSQKDAAGRWDYRAARPAAPLFADVSARVGIDFRHRENDFRDYDREPLIPHLLSTEGPALAVADVDGDGLDDVYVGGAKWQRGQVFLQQRDGTFRAASEPAGDLSIGADSVAEDVDAAFFDADGDGHPDLYVASGGNEFYGQDDAMRHRLYLNDGRGHFRRASDALPDFFDNGSCVVPGDFDGDGAIDLFVGSRVVSRRYGLPARSHLLHNDGRGHFTDVTTELAEGLGEAGMVTSATWIDYDHDGALDLVVVGEWMPVRVFHQENGHFVDRTREAGLSGTNGWWNSVSAADLNGDGRLDLVLGNLGTNSFLRASPKEPARLYVNDFAHDGTLQQILTSYRSGVSYPVAGRDELLALNPALRARFPSYAKFGAARIEDIFSATDVAGARVLEAYSFESAVALDRGNGTFDLRSLPAMAQIAPVYASAAGDFDGDGKPDLLLAGNFLGAAPVLGRGDASYGLLLHGRGDGRFDAVDLERSGVAISGQVRRMRVLRDAAGRTLVIAARNDDTPVILRATGGSATASDATRHGPSTARRGSRE